MFEFIKFCYKDLFSVLFLILILFAFSDMGSVYAIGGKLGDCGEPCYAGLGSGTKGDCHSQYVCVGNTPAGSGIIGRCVNASCPNDSDCNCSGGGGGGGSSSAVNGSCGTTNNSCLAGSWSDLTDSSTNYLWICRGSNGGYNQTCVIPKTTGSAGVCGSVVDTCSSGTYVYRSDTTTEDRWSCRGGDGVFVYCSKPKTTTARCNTTYYPTNQFNACYYNGTSPSNSLPILKQGLTGGNGSDYKLWYMWGNGAVGGTSETDTVSAIYRGNYDFGTGGTYEFNVGNDDGVRVYVSGKGYVFNDWNLQSYNEGRFRVSNMPSGRRNVTIYYYENIGRADLTVGWRKIITPTVNISADSTTISAGQSTNIRWNSTGATYCRAYNRWSGVKSTSGVQSTGALSNGSYTYTMRCYNQYGMASPYQSVTIDVKTDGVCNTNAEGYYSPSESDYRYPLCSSGSLAGQDSFPNFGETVSWNCNGSGAGSTSETCSANRGNMEQVDDCPNCGEKYLDVRLEVPLTRCGI